MSTAKQRKVPQASRIEPAFRFGDNGVTKLTTTTTTTTVTDTAAAPSSLSSSAYATDNGDIRYSNFSADPKLKRSAQTGFLSAFSGKSEFVFQALILGAVCILAFMCRLFSVVRYESVIHEFDPWFNFRTTRYLVSEGFYNFHNWSQLQALT